MEAVEAGISLIAKIVQMVADAKAAAAEKAAAIVKAFQAAESALDAAMVDAHARVEAEEKETEQVIADAEKTRP